jgi:hypothetical protein
MLLHINGKFTIASFVVKFLNWFSLSNSRCMSRYVADPLCKLYRTDAINKITKLRIYEWKDINFPFICSNIPAAPAYGVYISQLIRYSRTYGSCQDFIDRGLLLTRKLLNQGFILVKLKSSIQTFYGRHYDFVERYEISVSQMITDMFHSS